MNTTEKTKNDKNNYYRLIALLVDVSPKILRQIFKRHFLKGLSFRSYLEKNKHIIFHLYFTKKCCQSMCNLRSNRNRMKCLSKQQFLGLYEVSVPDCGSNNECICKYKERDDLKVLDITILFTILENCENIENTNYQIYQYMLQLKQVRNELLHKSDAKCVSEQEFEYTWNQVNGWLMGLAGLISTSYSDQTRTRIENCKTRLLLGEDMLHEITLAREWYNEKLLELEETEKEVRKALSGEEKDKMIEKLCQIHYTKLTETFEIISKQIGDINFVLKIDQRTTDTLSQRPEGNDPTGRKTVPVLFHVEIPTDWDKAKIIDELEDTKHSLDLLKANIRIRYFSINQIKMILDIVQCDPDVIENEIDRLLERIINASEVDTAIQSSLSATLAVIDEKDIPPIPDSCIGSSVETYRETQNEGIITVPFHVYFKVAKAEMDEFCYALKNKAAEQSHSKLIFRYFSTKQLTIRLDTVECDIDKIYDLLENIIKASDIDTSKKIHLSATLEVAQVKDQEYTELPIQDQEYTELPIQDQEYTELPIQDKEYIEVQIQETISKQIGEISCEISFDRRTRRAFRYEPKNSHTSNVHTGRRTLSVFLHIEIPIDWDTEQLVEGLKKTKEALDSMSDYLCIRYFSTEQLKIVLDVVQSESDYLIRPQDIFMQNFLDTVGRAMRGMLKRLRCTIS